MLHMESALYVRIQEARGALPPVPWHKGFARNMAYRVLGYFHCDVHGQPEVLLCSAQGQQCLMPITHLRAVAYAPRRMADCVALGALQCDDSLCLEELLRWSESASLIRTQALALA